MGAISKERACIIRILVAKPCVQEFSPLATNRQFKAMFNGVQVYVIPQDVPLNRLNEGHAGTLQSFEEIRAAEAHQSLACSGEIMQGGSFSLGRWRLGVFFLIVPKSVARQREIVDGIHNGVGIEPCILVIRITVIHGEGHRAWCTSGKI